MEFKLIIILHAFVAFGLGASRKGGINEGDINNLVLSTRNPECRILRNKRQTFNSYFKGV